MMNKTNSLKNGKPTIAVLIGSLTSIYQDKILRGANSAAIEKDFNLIGFSGGPFNSPDPLAVTRHTLFDLVDHSLIDGIIVPLSSHCRYIDKAQTQLFLDRFKDLPLINIGTNIAGYTNIMPNYNKGLSQLIQHYIVDHGYKRIAFFRGPNHHASSSSREQIFRKNLEKYNIPVYEDLIISSALSYEGAASAVTELLDNRKQTCDAIICVNDRLAIGVIDELNERHIKVPEDIAISGSLGAPTGIFSTPPLTTINEPLFELGYEAVMAIAKMFKGNHITKDILIPTELVKRRSCGCLIETKPKPKSFEQIKSNSYPSKEIEWQSLYEASMDQAHFIMEKHRSINDYQYIDNMMLLFYDSVNKSDFSQFLVLLLEQLNSVLKTPKIIPWLELVANFEYTGIELFRLTKDRAALENFLETISLIRDQITIKTIAFQNSETDFYINFSREIANNLNTSFDLNAVRTHAIKLLDLTDLYISVYTKKGNGLIEATNVMAVRNKKSITIPRDKKLFVSKHLIPESVDLYQERYSLIAFPLSFRQKPIGFLILSLSQRKGSAYENMQAIISTALKNELQIQELKDAEARFSDIAHSTSDWLWETDTHHLFTYSSISVKKVLGYTSEEVIGLSINQNALDKGISFFKKMQAQEILINKETWFTHKNGSLVCLIISSTPIIKDGHFVGYRGVFKDITAQKSQNDRIKNLAYFDFLTGLPNRTSFQEKLDSLVISSKTNNSRFAMIFIDLDRFKHINDSMGHAAGDQVLRIIGGILKESISSNDFIARLGGDEFTILIPDIKNDLEVVHVAKKILEKTIPPIYLHDKQLFVTVSIGIAIYPNDGENSTLLLKNADTAMYRAKSRGKNRYVFYDKQIEEKNVSRLQIETIIYNALNNNSFFVQYQPKINSYTKEITGFEALVRIKGPNSETIYPSLFIEIAEDLGLISQIDEIVLIQVCEQVKKWENEGLKIKPVSVNLSPYQLKNRDIVKTYISIVNHYKVPPQWIQLEITENALISNENLALDILTAFTDVGFTFALDDFGTGYSSLSCINLYPIHTIKIDKSFIDDISTSRTNVAIIKAIVQMADDLNLNIVAEGIESQEQYEHIKSLACNEIQGVYFSPPVDHHLAHDMLVKGRL